MRQKLRLCINARTRLRFSLLLVALLFSSYQSYAQISNDDDLQEIKRSSFFKNKYTKDMVWDCNRDPANAEAGKSWKLYRFQAPFDVSVTQRQSIDFKNDRYLQFNIQKWDGNPKYTYILNDLNETPYEVVISLELYEANGTFVKTISRHGSLQGLGTNAKGTFYDQENRYGTLLTMEKQKEGGSVEYTPEIGVATLLSQLKLVKGNNEYTIESDTTLWDNNGNAQKIPEGTIKENYYDMLTIGKNNNATPINIHIEKTTVKEETKVESYATATLTLSGKNDLGPVNNLGTLTFERGENLEFGENTTVTNHGKFTDHTGLISSVLGDKEGTGSIQIHSTMNAKYTIEKDSTKTIKIDTHMDANATATTLWQKRNELSEWVDITTKGRSMKGANFERDFTEAGEFRCLVTSKNNAVESTLTVYVTIEETIPTYYSINIPEVEGVNLLISNDSCIVEGGTDFSFALTLKPGYEQSSPIVKANGNVIASDPTGQYIIRNIFENQTITIEGVVHTPPIYYYIYIPKVDGVKYIPKINGVNLSTNKDFYTVEEGSHFSFALILKPGYEQSVPLVIANGNIVYLDTDELYITQGIYEDQTITISGIVKNIPTAIDKIGGTIVKAWGTDGILHVYTPQTTDIQIINFSGEFIKQKSKAYGENHFNLPKGSYIVVVGHETFKITL